MYGGGGNNYSYGGISLDDYTNSAAPMNMPVGQAPQANVDWAYGGSGYNPYAQNNTQDQYLDMLAQTQRFSGTPIYQLYGDSYAPQMTPEIKALWDKREAYNAMSPEEQMFARSTGNGYFNNADMGDLASLTVGNKSLDFQDIAGFNRWTDEFNDQNARNILAQDNGNMPSFSKQVADAQLNNKTWSAATANDRNNLALPAGNQLARILLSQMNHGVLPDQRTFQKAVDRDYYYDTLFGTNLNALQSGSGSREGMAGAGSGVFAQYGDAFRDPRSNTLEWGRQNGSEWGNKWGGGQPQVGPNLAWGTPEAYAAGYHTPYQFPNNTSGGRSGITEGVSGGNGSAPNLEGPGRGSWTGGPSSPGYGAPFNTPNPTWSDGGIPSAIPGVDKDWVTDPNITGLDQNGNPEFFNQAQRDNYQRMVERYKQQLQSGEGQGMGTPFNQNNEWYINNQPEITGSNYSSGTSDLANLLASAEGVKRFVPSPQDGRQVAKDDIFGSDWEQGSKGQKKFVPTPTLPFPGRYETGPIEAGQILARLLS